MLSHSTKCSGALNPLDFAGCPIELYLSVTIVFSIRTAELAVEALHNLFIPFKNVIEEKNSFQRECEMEIRQT